MPDKFATVARIDCEVCFNQPTESCSCHLEFVAALAVNVHKSGFRKIREIGAQPIFMTKRFGHQRMLELMKTIREQTPRASSARVLFEPWRYHE